MNFISSVGTEVLWEPGAWPAEGLDQEAMDPASVAGACLWYPKECVWSFSLVQGRNLQVKEFVWSLSRSRERELLSPWNFPRDRNICYS